MTFAGIDIGSTNTKILAMNEHGDIVMMSSCPTPKLTIDGLLYFDLEKLNNLIDEMLTSSKANAVAFSSVGESIVPIKNGKAISNPIFWDQRGASATLKERAILNENTSYASLGIIPNGLLAIEKILWYNRQLPERPDFYLPICHYQVFRKTGVAFYDPSQASRSGAYNVFSKSWIDKLYDKLAIQPFVPIKPIGSYSSYNNKVTYAVGGHDHILGLYGVSKIFNNDEIIYDSMGTSSTISLLTKFNSSLEGNNTYDSRGGGIVNGFENEEFIVFRGLNRYGSLLTYFMKTIGCDDIYQINSKIKSKKEFNLAFDLAVGGNFTSANIPFGLCNITNLNIMANECDVIMSIYHYLAKQSMLVYKNLLGFAQAKPLYVAGGLAIKNDILMKLKANYLKHEIVPFKITEVSAFGALCAAINGSGNESVFNDLAKLLAN